MDLTATSLAAFWLPLLVLITSVLVYGIRRDRGRPAGAVVVTAAVFSGLLLTAMSAFVGWGTYQQQRAEQAACTPSPDC